MLKETKTQETIAFFVTFLSLDFNWGRAGPHGPPPWLRICSHTASGGQVTL